MSRDEQLASLRADLDLERSLREAADRERDEAYDAYRKARVRVSELEAELRAANERINRLLADL